MDPDPDPQHWHTYQHTYMYIDVCMLKVVGNEKEGGFGKVASDRYWPRTVVINVRLSLYLAAILY